MDIDDASYSRHAARAGQPGADQDMTEVAEILLKMNVNSARQRRYSWSTVPPLCSRTACLTIAHFVALTQVIAETSAPNTSGCRELYTGSHAVPSERYGLLIAPTGDACLARNA